jgi:hypothetical protein
MEIALASDMAPDTLTVYSAAWHEHNGTGPVDVSLSVCMPRVAAAGPSNLGPL